MTNKILVNISWIHIFLIYHQEVESIVVQLLSFMFDSLWRHEVWNARLPCSSLHPSLFKLMSIESVMPSHTLSPLGFLSNFPNIRVFSNKLSLGIRWPKFWSFSISPFNEHSGLISFRIDKFDLFAVWVSLKSLLHHHSLKASILQCSAFFMVQLSHACMTTGKTTALTYGPSSVLIHCPYLS